MKIVLTWARSKSADPGLVSTLERGVREPSFEAMRASAEAARGFFEPADAETPARASGEVAKPFPAGEITECEELLTFTIPKYLDNGDGSVKAVPHDAPTDSECFGSLGQAAVHGGVCVSVFDRPVKAEPLYDGAEALRAGSVKDLDPVGVRAEYRVAVLDGQVLQPPAHPEDLPPASCENETTDTPEP